MEKNGKKILVTEDEKPIAHALQLKLQGSGYEVDVAHNGEEALKFLSEGTYDLMLLDLVMPVMDGFATLQQVKEHGYSVPIIVLSNLSQTDDEKKAKDLGAIDFAIKSNVPLSEIVAKINKQLS